MGKLAFISRNAARLTALALFFMVAMTQPSPAADLPLASMSPLAGIGFDDKPLILPVQRNFQMAMLTAGSELGRSCGKMEAYGWRMGQTEQGRVDQIFNSTVDRLRGLGYVVELQTPTSISHDITMFTADRQGKHLLSMWSAGEIGLVMVLCETSTPQTPMRSQKATAAWPSSPSYAQDVVQSKLEAPAQAAIKNKYTGFTPVGTWVGSYICGQGYTGGTLVISKMHGENFEGTFHFYPTAKNPGVPDGKYIVFGQYDRESQRILINPGKWIKRPKDYYDTIMVGNFDVMNHTLSAYFQGVNGCTSFEARTDKYDGSQKAAKKSKTTKKAKPKKAAKTTAEKPAATSLDVPKADTAKPDLSGIAIPAKEDLLKSDAVPTPAPAFAPQIPAGSTAVPAVALTPPAPANKEAAPLAVPPAPVPTTSSAPAANTAPAVPGIALPPAMAPTTSPDAQPSGK
jgi:hypothetical protein